MSADTGDINPLIQTEGNEEDEISEATSTTTMGGEFLAKTQYYSNVVSHVLALIAMLMVGWWIHILGGLTWKAGEAKRVFNWHPLLMVTAFCFMTVAALAFRYRCMTRQLCKLTHAISWSVATLCGAIALVSVFASHNDATSGFIANMYSLHSWIGILVVTFYLLQWTVGLYAFYFGDPAWKGLAFSVHKHVGPLLYQAVAVTILLGIQEKEGFIGCGYKVTEIDRFPHIGEIPLVCRVSHGLGLIVAIMAFSTTFALHDFRRPTQDDHVL